MSNIVGIWRAGRVMRWHTNPHLCETIDPDDGHAARVTMIALQLEPDLSRCGIIRALTHDLGEHAVGDFSYTVKRKNPDLAAILEEMELAAIRDFGPYVMPIANRERAIIKLADWLDAWLWMAMHRPGLRHRADWIAQRETSKKIARRLGVIVPVEAVISEIETELAGFGE